MDTKSGYEDGGDDPRDARGSEPNREAPPVDPSTPPSSLRARLRRLILRSLRPVAYAAVAAVFGLLGGWLSHSVLEDDSPAVLESGSPSASSPDALAASLFPEGGVNLDVRWGDIARRLVEEGVIDLEKFSGAAQRAGSPLTDDQLKVLTEGSDEAIIFSADNAYFMLDVLWALGLANENKVLTEGPIAQNGLDQAARYASTGGWTIGVQPGPEYLAALELISLTPEQQAIVDDVAYNSYRPCCGNMSAFPDCNHGMATLGLAELMASQGASADDIFQALKEISPFWFPNQYHQLALYFEGQDQGWEDVDARVVMGNEYSSSGGFKQVSALLQQQGALGAGGPAGGNASGCAP
jgi:hypothetical protein